MENPIKMDDLGVPLFSETSIYTSAKITWIYQIYISDVQIIYPNCPACYVCYSSPSIAPCKPSPQHHDGSFLPQWVQPNEPCQQTSPRCRPSLAGSSSLNIYQVPTRKLSHLGSDQQKKNIVLWRNPKVAHLGHLLRKEVSPFFLGNIF